MSFLTSRRAFRISVVTAISVFAQPVIGQSSQEADGARLLRGAIDMHFHMDAPTPKGTGEHADIAKVRVAQSRGLRALVIKNHFEPTATLAYHLRPEVPNLELFGGIVMNRTNGGMNAAAVEYMATQLRDSPGKVVWMPAFDSEIESRTSKQPNKPFVALSRNGELLPEVKAVIAVIAKNGLILASGHIAPEEALMVFQEGRRQGVTQMIATHAMDLAGKMTMDQMLAAAKLGAIIEFDFRNTLSEGARRVDAIRKIGPERCLISEFWTKTESPIEYAGLAGMGAFAAAMRSRGFTDHELDLMFKENPARLLGLNRTVGQR
jgi:Family of unknown function (DUF6282)